MSEEIKTIGQRAYEAYAAHSGGVSLVSGAALPAWDDTDERIRDAWQAAALAVTVAPLTLSDSAGNVLAAAHTYTAGCDGLHPLGQPCAAANGGEA